MSKFVKKQGLNYMVYIHKYFKDQTQQKIIIIIMGRHITPEC